MVPNPVQGYRLAVRRVLSAGPRGGHGMAMRRLTAIALVLMAASFGAQRPALAQPLAPTTSTSRPIPPLGWYAIGSLGCAAAAPMIGTIVLHREMTAREVWRTTLGCVLGPLGWYIGVRYIPLDAGLRTPPRRPPPPGSGQANGRRVSIPVAGTFVPNEVLVEFAAGTPPAYITALGQRLQMTQLETQTFTLTGRTLQRWRIDGTRSVPDTLRVLARDPRVSAAQANLSYLGTQAPPSAPPGAAQGVGAAQYIVSKLHLLEAHRITSGDDVTVAVIDSPIDTNHPDLAGVFAGTYDALGTPAQPHAHGTGMAGAIAAHAQLIGVAPKVKLLAIASLSGGGGSAQGSTFTIMKGLDWSAAHNARVVNMSFAGPQDAMLADMLAKAHARGIVLIAAVGNAGPRSPPLYPAADRFVIGVTATDSDDRLLPVANRGPQVVVAAPGVDILAPAPDAKYQMTSGTSIATAHVTGIAALLLARNPALTPDQVRAILIQTAHRVPGDRRDFGAGVVDALEALRAAPR